MRRERGVRDGESGQAMVEFAMVIGLFLLCLLGAMSASLYTVQRAAAVTGVAAGARVAAGGTADPAGAAGANTPDLAGAIPAVSRVVAPVLFGTRIRQLQPGRACPAPGAIPSGEVDVCATRSAGTVAVRLRGRPAAAVPVPGLDWTLDLVAEVHTVTFSG